MSESNSATHPSATEAIEEAVLWAERGAAAANSNQSLVCSSESQAWALIAIAIQGQETNHG